ncbi:MAG: TadE/TadG family type IV pilus assembly protein [Caulobacteraceae bacterium]
MTAVRRIAIGMTRDAFSGARERLGTAFAPSLSNGAGRALGAARRVARDRSGAAAVEFALLVWPFLALAFGSLQLLLIFFLGQVTQTVAVQAGRAYMTGQVAGDSQTAFKTAVCAKLPAVFFNCADVIVDVQTASTASGLNTTPLTPTYKCTGTPPVCKLSNTGAYTASAPLSYVILRVMYAYPVLGGAFAFADSHGFIPLIGTSVFQVEPYPTS